MPSSQLVTSLIVWVTSLELLQFPPILYNLPCAGWGPQACSRGSFHTTQRNCQLTAAVGHAHFAWGLFHMSPYPQERMHSIDESCSWPQLPPRAILGSPSLKPILSRGVQPWCHGLWHLSLSLSCQVSASVFWPMSKALIAFKNWFRNATAAPKFDENEN